MTKKLRAPFFKLKPLASRVLTICLMTSVILVQPANGWAGDPAVCHDVGSPDPAPNPAPTLAPNRLFYFDIGPHRYAVPWLYLLARPRTDAQSCLKPEHLLAFQFRYLTVDPKQGADVAYAYGGSEPPSKAPADWVRVDDLRYYEATPEDYYNPERRFINTITLLPKAAVRTRIQDLEVIQLNGAGHTAWHGKTADTEVYFTCVLPFSCTGFLDLKDLKISASIVVSRRAVSDFWSVEKTLRLLLENWKER